MTSWCSGWVPEVTCAVARLAVKATPVAPSATVSISLRRVHMLTLSIESVSVEVTHLCTTAGHFVRVDRLRVENGANHHEGRMVRTATSWISGGRSAEAQCQTDHDAHQDADSEAHGDGSRGIVADQVSGGLVTAFQLSGNPVVAFSGLPGSR